MRSCDKMQIMEKWFWMIHEGTKREGPGLDSTTLEIWNRLPGKERLKNGLDIGCGPGSQTLVLAQNSDMDWTAIDTHQPFLDKLKDNSYKLGLENKISIVNVSMTNLPFEREEFDIIWSEGAIYIMGFENGLESFGEYLKEGGYLVASEISWLKQEDEIPKECFNSWKNAYNEIATREENIETAQKHGYEVIETVVLSNKGWEEYYSYIGNNIKKLYERYPENEELKHAIELEIEEIDMFKKYNEFYGYVFYVLRKSY